MKLAYIESLLEILEQRRKIKKDLADWVNAVKFLRFSLIRKEDCDMNESNVRERLADIGIDLTLAMRGIRQLYTPYGSLHEDLMNTSPEYRRNWLDDNDSVLCFFMRRRRIVGGIHRLEAWIEMDQAWLEQTSGLWGLLREAYEVISDRTEGKTC